MTNWDGYQKACECMENMSEDDKIAMLPELRRRAWQRLADQCHYCSMVEQKTVYGHKHPERCPVTGLTDNEMYGSYLFGDDPDEVTV